RKLERWSNSAPRGMAVIARGCKIVRRNKIRPIGLLHFFGCALNAWHFYPHQTRFVTGSAPPADFLFATIANIQ
ncbi:MAG: hypothetical protein ABI575_01840, partial [Oxalobacteraceae bacterium]